VGALVGPEPGFALLGVAFVAGLDRDLVAVGAPGRRNLRDVPGEVLDVRERGEHAVRRGSDVLRVLVLYLWLLSPPGELSSAVRTRPHHRPAAPSRGVSGYAHAAGLHG
jgi:hypothetical protein